ncbi:MAG: hypothetical protein ACYC1E_18620, partial [Propionibacteriaceae bacterium]
HWRSPFAQGILEGYSGPLSASRIKAYADAGVIGMLFGAGQADQTHPWDQAADGVTNGGNVANYGSTQGATVSTLSDDDGGYLRIRVGNYYTQGVLPLSGAPSPTHTATAVAAAFAAGPPKVSVADRATTFSFGPGISSTSWMASTVVSPQQSTTCDRRSTPATPSRPTPAGWACVDSTSGDLGPVIRRS